MQPEDRKVIAMRIVRWIRTAAILLIVAVGGNDLLAQSQPAEIIALNQQVDRLLKASKLAEAAVVTGRLVAITREQFGEIVPVLRNFGNIHTHATADPLSMKKPGTMYRCAFDIPKGSGGADHKETLAAMAELATIYRSGRRYEEAKRLLQQLLASHRSGMDESGTLSAMELLAPSDEDDGLLTASEAAQLKLDADWVILSVCNSAAGNMPSAEWPSRQAGAFSYAGARALFVSNWPLASAAAMSGVPHEAHPANWAPFLMVGEGAGGPAAQQ